MLAPFKASYVHDRDWENQPEMTFYPKTVNINFTFERIYLHLMLLAVLYMVY